MANTKVVFNVTVNTDAKELYLVGSNAQLGAWNPSKAIKMEYCDCCKKFTAAKMLPAGEAFEFKLLNAKSWDNVEKAECGAEVENHTAVAAKGLVVEVVVNNFAK